MCVFHSKAFTQNSQSLIQKSSPEMPSMRFVRLKLLSAIGCDLLSCLFINAIMNLEINLSNQQYISFECVC